MPQTEEELWERARLALIKLEKQILNHPAVTLIDIGDDPEEEGSKRLVLRVHVRQSPAGRSLDLPSDIDGIPVRVIRGEYRLE
jgi:hypothetical protein